MDSFLPKRPYMLACFLAFLNSTFPSSPRGGPALSLSKAKFLFQLELQNLRGRSLTALYNYAATNPDTFKFYRNIHHNFENFTGTLLRLFNFCRDTVAIFGIFDCCDAAIFCLSTTTNICVRCRVMNCQAIN